MEVSKPTQNRLAGIDLKMSRDDLLLSSTELEQFFYRDRIRLESDLFSPMTIDHECLGRLEQWTQSTEIQILAISGPEFECTKVFSQVRFHQLDGTADTWDDATALFRDIRELLPGRIFCVIDGFQWLDDKSTAKHLVEFVEILRQSRLKVLFTTNSHSRCLLGCLSQSELLILDRTWNKSSRLEFDEISMEL
jgi:hypothetical protein